MKTTLPLLVLLIGAAGLMPQAQTKQTLLMNRLGPSQMVLYVAKADGSGERPLLSSSGFDYNASFSPDGQWIVFTSERAGSGQADLYRVRTDGSGLERLTDDAALDDQGALSPDGRALAFVSTRGAGVPNIWVLDLRTKQARNLTGGGTLPAAGGNLKGAFRPSWSPDGRWIAFTSDRHYPFRPHKEPGPGWEHLQELNIYLIQPDGQGLRRLTQAGVTTGSPKWSADGRRIVFYEAQTEMTFAARIQAQGRVTSQIVSVDVASGARTVHTSGPGLKVSPQYLRADRIAYVVKAAPQPAQTGLASTSGAAIVGGTFRNPSWSPDASLVVYQKADYTARPQNQPLYSWEPGMDVRYTEVFPHFSKDGRLAVSEIRNLANTARAEVAVMNADGSNRKVVYAGGPGAAFFPTWSPDGQWIAVGVGGFFGARDSQPAKLLLVRSDGSQQTRELTNGLPNAGFPSYSPDGARIAYRVWGEQGGKPQYGIRVMTLADGSVKTLTTEMDNFPSWSPAGDLIAFTRRIGGADDYDYDIFTMRPDGTSVRRLTTTPGNDGHSFWSPDGRFILWSSGRNGFKDESALYDNSFQPFAQIYIMNADGSNQRPLTHSRWEDSMPGLVPQLSAQTTVFTTKDYRQDRDRWTDPAYFLHNTARELTDMQVENRFGQKGSGADKYDIRSPYPFKTSWEHYQAWLKRANGGTRHTFATLPDWDGIWNAGRSWLDSTDIQASTMAAALTPQYREYYVQQVKAEAEGRHWWAAAFCLPDGFIRAISRGPQQFFTRPRQVLLITDQLVATQVRWIDTDGRDHRPEREQFAQWMGESVGFWEGNALVIHTNQIRQWNATHSLFEWSDQLTAVERYERVGDEIVGELTLYDPVAFLSPLHAKLRFAREKTLDRMVYSTCADTNGPSPKVYAGPDGVINERIPGDPLYWDPTDPRPWAKHYAIGEKR